MIAKAEVPTIFGEPKYIFDLGRLFEFAGFPEAGNFAPQLVQNLPSFLNVPQEGHCIVTALITFS